VVDKEIEEYRKQALGLWFKGGSCTGQTPTEEQDSKNEDDEFKRVEEERRLREKTKAKFLITWP
jgi:hypothetical protein